MNLSEFFDMLRQIEHVSLVHISHLTHSFSFGFENGDGDGDGERNSHGPWAPRRLCHKFGRTCDVTVPRCREQMCFVRFGLQGKNGPGLGPRPEIDGNRRSS